MSYETQANVALVTGASSGIGAVYADRLARRGYDLIVVARDEARLEALSDRLAKETGRSVSPLRADLTDKADLANVERVLRDNAAITTIVNNAGIGAVTPLLETEVRKVDDLIALNIAALTRLTYAAAPAFVARGSGTIINIASTCCQRGGPARLKANLAAGTRFLFPDGGSHVIASRIASLSGN